MRWCVIAALLSVTVSVPGRSFAQAEAPPIRVMTFNIRGDFDHAKPTVSPEAWIAVSGEHRRDLVTALVQQHDPDILGVQEAFDNQIVDLRNVLLGHAHYGVGRDDGEKTGEQSAIFYRTERFAPIEQGSFWLSESPDVAGSVFPGAGAVRIASWVILRDATTAGKEYFVLNTHWDHVSQDARIHSAKLIRKKIPTLAGDRPLIVMGDMNVDDANPALTTLLGPGDSPTFQLHDGYRDAMPERCHDEATYHAFRGTATGNRIDYVLHSAAFRSTRAMIVRSDFSGRYPSDHFPVVIVLQP